MPKEMLIKASLCTGCSTCSLACSLQNRGEFRPSRAFVRIARKDLEGLFEINFSSACRGCCACARSCPSGALKVIEVAEK